MCAGAYELGEWLEEGRVELYDVGTDIGEEHDLSGAMPQLAGELRRALDQRRARVGTRPPDPGTGASGTRATSAR